MSKNKLFFVLEGGDGSGKTSLLHRLYHGLQEKGYTVYKTREPGGNKICEAIRSIIVSGTDKQLDPITEMLLLTAARREHTKKIVAALERGEIVLCDRYIGSTLAYQGARGASWQDIFDLHKKFCWGIQPQLTILLDIDPEIGLRRAQQRAAAEAHKPETRFESMGLDIHRQIRAHYLIQAQQNPSQYVIIDATQPPKIIFHQAIAAIVERLQTTQH